MTYSHGNLVKAACLSAAFVSAPLLEAHAQNSPTIVGTSRTLNNSNGNPVTTYGYDQIGQPHINVVGPGTLAIRVYPTIGTDVRRPTRNYAFSYQLDGSILEVSNLTSRMNSGFTTPLRRGDEVGSPSELQINIIGEGNHSFTPLSPNGFIEVVGFTPTPAPVPLPVRLPTPTLTGSASGNVGSSLNFRLNQCASGCLVRAISPTNQSVMLTPDPSGSVTLQLTTRGTYQLSIIRDGAIAGQPTSVVANEISQEHNPQVDEHSHPRFSAEFFGTALLPHAETPFGIESLLDVQYHHVLSPKLTIDAGLYGGLNLLGLNTADQQANLTLPWGSAIGGIAYDINHNNRISAAVFAGYQHASLSSTYSLGFNSTNAGNVLIGGRVEYHGQYVRALIEGSNNFYAPVDLRLGYVIPRTWTRNVNPVLWVGASLLREPTETRNSIYINGSELSPHIYGFASIPIYRIGSVVPSLLVGGGATTAGVIGINFGLKVELF